MGRLTQATILKDNTQKQKKQPGIISSLFKAASPFMDPMMATVGNAAFGLMSGDQGLAESASQIAHGLMVPEGTPPPTKEEPPLEPVVDSDADKPKDKENPQLTAFLQTNPGMADLFAANPDMRDMVLNMLNYGQQAQV